MNNETERPILRIILATGISSVATQLLTIREFLSQFHGNEFVIALVIFNWLILGGAGTLISRFISIKIWPPSAGRLGAISLCLAVLPVIQIMAIRVLRDVFFVHGTSVGFYPTLAYIFFSIAPYTLLLGFTLPYSLYVLRTENPGYSPAKIYIIDNLGDVTGGVLFSFLLVHFLTPFRAEFIVNLPLIVLSWLLFSPVRKRSPLVVTGMVISFIILLSGLILEYPSLSPPEGKLVHYTESRYGRVTVHKDREQATLFSNGSPVLSTHNPVVAEETIHYPLSQLDNIKHVLLISSESGIIKELQKYEPEKIDYLEIDPAVTEAQIRFHMIKPVPVLNIIHRDGRAFLTESNGMYDAVIVNIPEPSTFQLNRFYTSRFFTLVKKRLKPNGILSFSLQGFENYLAEPQRQKVSSVYNTVSEHFRNVLMLPGQKIFFLCSNHPISSDIPALIEQKGISTEYISNYYYGNLTKNRISYLNKLVDPSAPRNSDISPRLMRLMFSQWFAKFSTSPNTFIVLIFLFITAYLIRTTREEVVLFTTGCVTMGSEILVIFAFQIFYGYIYFQIGLIITVFLAGLLPGAWLGDSLLKRKKQVLILTDLALILLLVIFVLSVGFYSHFLSPLHYLVFGFVVSLVCGCQFPVALDLQGGDNRAVSRSFSADMIGAALGTLVTSVALIPYLGLIWTSVCLIMIKIASIIVSGTKS